MLFSRASEYGIRATLYLATCPEQGPVLVRTIAEALHIPVASLAKVVQNLTRQRLLVSQKGPGGGVMLARSAEKLTLLQVVEAVEGQNLSRECILGIAGCSEATVHCPLHEQWGAIRERVLKMLGEESVAQFADQLSDRDYVLARNRSEDAGEGKRLSSRLKSKRARSAGEGRSSTAGGG